MVRSEHETRGSSTYDAWINVDVLTNKFQFSVPAIVDKASTFTQNAKFPERKHVPDVRRRVAHAVVHPAEMWWRSAKRNKQFIKILRLRRL